MDISPDIIARASRGDMEAFEDIYRKTSAFVYNVSLRVTRNPEDAEEITQDVFMKVYRSLRKFNAFSSLRTWIYRITVNTAFNRIESSKKHVNKRADYDTAIQSISTGERARDNVAREDDKERASEFLAMLNTDQRICVILREMEGLNYKEIAGALKINVNTVRSRLKRAREKLMAIAGKR